MKSTVLTSISAVVLSLSIALPAAALDVNSTVKSTVNGVVQVGGSNGSVGADVDANVNVGEGTNAQASSTGGASNTNAGGDASVSSGTSVSVDLSPLLVTRADVEAKTVESASIAPTAVKTKADLSGYVASQIKSDANINKVQASASDVAVTYKQRAKLFGFIPVTVNATALVDASGKVKVSYPWYAVITATNKADLEAKLQQRINAELSAQGALGAEAAANADATAELTASQQAQLISDIRTLMKDEFEASVQANASGSASIQ